MFQQSKWKSLLESKEEFFLVEWYKLCGLWGEVIVSFCRDGVCC